VFFARTTTGSVEAPFSASMPPVVSVVVGGCVCVGAAV